jgi:glycosyltransferase involved in cell wall biosynthesis
VSLSPTNTISIIVPARDEEPRLAGVVRGLLKLAPRHFDDFELIIVNDGSTDRTAEVAEQLAREDARIQVVHHARPRSLGGAFKSGLTRAAGEYVTVVHGGGGTAPEELGRIWELKGRAAMVIPFIANFPERGAVRRAISRSFTNLVNLLFGLRIRYYLHHVLYRRAALRGIRIRTNSYAYQAEAILKLIRRGADYVEVGVRDVFEGKGPTRFHGPRNLAGVAWCLLACFIEVHLSRGYNRSWTCRSN